MSVNKVILLGRLGTDPELRYTPSAMPVCNFSVATSDNWTDKEGNKQERTEWHRIVVWGKLGELCDQYLNKGKQAYIEGKLQTRSWEDKEGNKKYTTEVLAYSVQFIGGDNNNGSAQREGNYQDENVESFQVSDAPKINDSDIPF